MANLVYAVPGVYVDENSSPVPNVASLVSLPPSRVALVGPGIGYQIETDSLVLTSTTAVTIPQTGIIAASLVVKSLSGTTYALTTDYVIVQTGSPAEEYVTTIARSGGSTIGSGDTVYVSYRYANSAYYLPFLSQDWDEIQSRYGAAIDSTGAIASPLSLAAKIVMEQGAREMILVPTKGSTPTAVTAAQITAALITLETRDDVGVVVPVGTGITGTDGSPGDTATLGTALKNHVEAMSAIGQYRTGVYGFDTMAVRTHATVALSIASSRVDLVYPNIMNWYNGYTNTTMEIGGIYLAAAIAGMAASQKPQEPLTRKSVNSFSSIPSRIFSTMTKSAKDTMSSSGVLVVEQLADGRLVVRHGVTTNFTTVLTREVSIVRAKDAMMRLVFQSLDKSGMVGSPMVAETPVRIRAIVEGALDQCVNAGIFIGFSNLAVRLNAGDSTAIDVKYAYQPSYPLNKVNVSFSINSVTGNIGEI